MLCVNDISITDSSVRYTGRKLLNINDLIFSNNVYYHGN